jgi:DNA-binding transcriptional ArsR family regulator
LTAEGLRRLLNYLITGTRGGYTRSKIIEALKEQPQNAHQLMERLTYDYSTIRHHLDVLVENGLVVTKGDRYGQVYSISPELESNYPVFLEIWNTSSRSARQ